MFICAAHLCFSSTCHASRQLSEFRGPATTQTVLPKAVRVG